MSPAEHLIEAERYLDMVDDRLYSNMNMQRLARAQVHATLATVSDGTDGNAQRIRSNRMDRMMAARRRSWS